MTLRYEHLVGIPFVWAKQDCFALVRHFFADNFDMKIADYARPNDWSSERLDLMRACFAREGFNQLIDLNFKDLRPADVLCMSIGDTNPNHFAIYVSDNLILHHLVGQLSRTDTLRDFWRNSTSFALRHPDVPDLRPALEEVDFMDLVRARNSPSL